MKKVFTLMFYQVCSYSSYGSDDLDTQKQQWGHLTSTSEEELIEYMKEYHIWYNSKRYFLENTTNVNEGIKKWKDSINEKYLVGGYGILTDYKIFESRMI